MVTTTVMKGLVAPLLALATLTLLLTPLSLVMADDTTDTTDTIDTVADYPIIAELEECPDHVILFGFDSFRWQGEQNSSSTSDDIFVIEVTATATCIDSFPSIPLPLTEVNLVYTSSEGILIDMPGYGSFNSPTMTLYFPLNITTINFLTEVYYVASAVINGKEDSTEWAEDNARKWSPFWLNSAAQFTMKMSPSVIQAHYLQPLNLTRLSHVGNLTTDDICTPAADEPDACYVQTDDPERLDICISENSTYAADGSILICDDSVQVVTVNDTTELDHVQLSYEYEWVSVTHRNPNTSLELYQYISSNESYELCPMTTLDGSSVCNLTAFTPSNETYLIRMVELDDTTHTPTSSREILVQDFNVTIETVSDDTAQVSWNSANSERYEVTISPAPQASYSGREVNCMDSQCDFFFIGLQGNWTDYSIAVRNVIGDEFTSEVIPYLEDLPDNTNTAMHRITSLDHYTKDNYDTTSTDACLEVDQSFSVDVHTIYARLLLIDSTGLSLQSTEEIEKINNTTYCFTDGVQVPKEFITTDQARVMVDFEISGSIYSTQLDVFLFTPDFQQVSDSSARATWRNLNSAQFFTSRAPTNSEERQQLECSYTGKQCFYYVNEDQSGTGNFSLLESSDQLDQTSTVQVQMNDISEELVIVTPFSVRHDDRLQICFNDAPAVDHYELGVELLGELVSSNQDAPIEKDEAGLTCAVSSEAVMLGAYEELWAVVVGYDAGGAILTAGEGQYKATFLSANRFVLGVTEGTEGPVTLKASWYILDDTSPFDFYYVTLVDEAGNMDYEPETIDNPTHEFSITKEGLYSVCVSVEDPNVVRRGHSKQSGRSEETCSDIITVTFSTDAPEPVPMVDNVQKFYTDDKKVKLSWDRPADASALLVSWRNDALQTKSAINERSLSPIRTTRRKTGALESSQLGPYEAVLPLAREIVPLAHARTLQDSNNLIRRVELTDITSNGFALVPASQSSLDIPINAGTWNICVSAVENHQAGDDNCVVAQTSINLVSTSPPTNLVFADGNLTWAAPEDKPPKNYTYYIECSRGPETLSFTTDQTSLFLEGMVEAGEWHVALHSVDADTRKLSKEQTIVIVVNGIKVTYEQTGLRDITLSWEETFPSAEDDPLTYIVTLEGNDPVTTSCSGLTDCSVTFTNVQAKPSDELTVTVQREEMKEILPIFFLDIGVVDPALLYRTLNDDESATVTWDCLEDVSFYNVTLQDEEDVVLYHDKQTTMPCQYIFPASSSTSLKDDVVLLQACLTSPTGERCGDPQRLALAPDGGTANPESSNVLVIVLSSVAAGLLLIIMVAGIVYKLRKDKTKQSPKGGDDGSVHSSESQHSINPPADQPTTTELAVNKLPGQNPQQVPNQRQTPVLYRSAASAPRSVQKTQPQSNGGNIELSIGARQNPDAVQAPLSSVNPNVRYQGPTQRNVQSNPLLQQLPRGSNPAPQRLPAPRQVGPFRGPTGMPVNSNVRPAGPPRMNTAVGPPRMNNAAAAPMNFNPGQQRSPPQGVRMNRPPSSQPVQILGRFSGAPIAARPTQMSPTRATAPRSTGPQMLGSPTRYPQPQRSGLAPTSPTRLQTRQPLPAGLRPIPRVGGGGGGGYVDMGAPPPGMRQARSDGRQFSPGRMY